MLKNKKKLLITIALLLIATFGISVVAYTLAGAGSGESNKISSEVKQSGASLDGNLGFIEYVSNIDLIIEDSNTEANYMYNIVNIVPSNLTGTHSIEKYAVTDANFKKLVIDAHSEKDGIMKPNTVQVITLYLNANIEASTPASTATGLSFEADYTVSSLLGDADLIYIESPTEASYTGSYAMTDSVYSYIKNNYAGDHKPIILDRVTSSGTQTETKTTYRTLINQISTRYLYSPVFGWDAAQSTEDFLAGKGSSHFFSKVISSKASGKILVLKGPEGTTSGDWIKERFAVKENMGSIYYGKTSHFPDDFEVTERDVSTLTDAAELEGYEFIIIENSATKIEIDADKQTVYDALIEMANGTQYIIYDSANVDPADNSGGNGGNKYKDLLNDLVTEEGAAKYSYVLPVSNGFFDADAATTAGADLIADIINGSNYRGSENNGRNGKKFRVLEIQPCYPIDTDLALSKPKMSASAVATTMGIKGNYYTNPGDVLQNTSVDEANGSEYYAFEVTPAKVAKATGLTYNQIQVDQMSTDEFISSKEVVLDTYDFVYIGGNVSALTPHLYHPEFGGNYTSMDVLNSYIQSQYVTSFDMYTHTGIATHLQGYSSNSTSGLGGDPYGTVANAMGYKTSTVLNGNDITALKLEELKDYIDAGMPIVFSDAVSNAFEKVYDKSRTEKLSAHDIDPDSNMFKLLDYAYWKFNPSGYKGVDSTIGSTVDTTISPAQNIKWNLDISNYATNDDYNRNTNKMYGAKAGEYVTVFNTNTADEIVDVIQDSAMRPSLIVTKAPEDYSRGDATTYNTKEDNKMTIKANVVANADDGNDSTENGQVVCKLVLYVDQDGDGAFDEDEIVDGGTASPKQVVCSEANDGKSETIDMTYEFPMDDFFGLVSWKLVASVYEEGVTHAQPCDVKTGFAYYKREDEVEKKDVRMLQIMPVSEAQAGFTTGSQDAHTLYMCTECQLAAYKAKYNLASESAGSFHTNTTGTLESYAKVDYLGLHEHKFGIVEYDTNGQKIDSRDKNGADDWDSNFADELADDYNFDLDILLIDEFHAMSELIEANTLSDGTTLTPMDNNNGIDRKDENGNAITAIYGADGNAITWVDYYQSKADSFYDQWQTAQGRLDNSNCEENMVSFLTNLQEEVGTGKQGNIGIVDADQIQQWIEHKAYYNYFMYYSGYYNFDSKYLSYYNEWTSLHDEVVKYHNLYNEYSCYACTKDEWLGKNYNMVVLGFAEDFGGKDLTINECDAVKKYVSDGGSLLATHDSTTRYNNAGSVNLTTQLRSVFGMDRFHVTIDEVATAGGTVTNSVAHLIYLKRPNTEEYYGPVMLTNKNVTIKLVKDYNVAFDNGSKKVIDVYSVEETSDCAPGSNFKITYELYDTVADAENGQKSANNWGYGNTYFQYYDTTNQGFGYKGGNAFQNGTYTINDGNFALTSTTATNLRRVVYNFADPKYFATEKSVLGNSVEARVLWEDAANKYFNIGNGGDLFGIVNLIGNTDSIGIYETSSHLTSPYTYAEYNLQNSITYAIGVDYSNESMGGTNKASLVNEGIVTTYPFTLGEELTISPTHAQTYAVDLEDSNMAVWYTLSGSNIGTDSNRKSRSSLYAASPYDGMDNYFLYSYQYGKGCVHYCGAGHSVVTGADKNNNDERMLYINIIIDSVRNSGSRPKITVLDKNNKKITENSKGDLKLDSNGKYVYSLDNVSDYPEFNFDVKFSSLSGGLSQVLVFYDLNYDGPYGDYSNKYTDDDNHVLIHEYTGPFANDDADQRVKVEENKINVELRKDLYFFDKAADAPEDEPLVDRLALNVKKDKNGNTIDYFKNYGNYTYIVIWAKDMNGKTAYARIKINLLQTLFDLTDNSTIEYPLYYWKGIYSSYDITDRIKFNI